jgi:hypothetical protein
MTEIDKQNIAIRARQYMTTVTQTVPSLTQDDHTIANDILQLFVNNYDDVEYNTSWMKQRPAFNITWSKEEDTFSLDIVNLNKVSMRKLMELNAHDMVHDVVVEADASNMAGGKLNVLIKLHKMGKKNKNLKKHIPIDKIEINDSLAGLTLFGNNKDNAKDAMELFTNMSETMYEPEWEIEKSTDNLKYQLIARPVMQMTLSFYVYMTQQCGTFMNNITIEPYINYVSNNTAAVVMHCITIIGDAAISKARKNHMQKNYLKARSTINKKDTWRNRIGKWFSRAPHDN